MNANRIVGWIALAVAVLGAFMTVPHAALILLLAGLYMGSPLSRG
jgi:uncharacterized membrane protein YbaN (DUF454 family)